MQTPIKKECDSVRESERERERRKRLQKFSFSTLIFPHTHRLVFLVNSFLFRCLQRIYFFICKSHQISFVLFCSYSFHKTHSALFFYLSMPLSPFLLSAKSCESQRENFSSSSSSYYM